MHVKHNCISYSVIKISIHRRLMLCIGVIFITLSLTCIRGKADFNDEYNIYFFMFTYKLLSDRINLNHASK